jgi:hypothetical protein
MVSRLIQCSLCLAAALAWIACESSDSAPDGGASGSDLSGTWDVIATPMGKQPFELTVTIDAQHLEVATGSGAFTLERDANGFSATHTIGASSQPITVTRKAAGTMALGAIPLDLAGDWSGRNAGASDGLGCDGTLSASSVSALCTGTRFPSWMDGYNPGSGNASGAKEADAASIFGDLGGTWRVSFSKGDSCTFRFEGSTFSSDCGSALGSATITFSGGAASGSSTSGYEFSAHRR